MINTDNETVQSGTGAQEIEGTGEDDLETVVNQLKRGLISRHHPTKAKAYKRLYEAGAKSIPLLLRELELIEFKKNRRPEMLVLATGLLVILHDLDEEISEKFIKKAISEKCDDTTARAFNSILRFKRSNFLETKVGDTIILEDKAIDKRHQATKCILKWLESIPFEDYERVPRIYLIPYKSHYDFSGYHLNYISVLTVVWYTNKHPYNPIQLLNRLFKQITLYHEIGHHFHKHIEGGQVPDQEEEADAYAYKMLLKARPKMKVFFRTLYLLMGKIKKKNQDQSGI
ncbi:hypothetical protein [Kiloniella sp.]|uniref:hypothetical protein n=1 Tax=Kiloniella sp. TaxID=1938587 RepID=UPI003B02EA6F